METQNIILVGTDFSPSSDRAFAKACAIARHTGERIHLLHVVEPVDEPGSQDRETQEFYTKLTQISEAKFQEQEADQGAIISLTHSFHGRTNATLAITGNKARKTRGGPYPSGIAFAPAPYVFRKPFNTDDPEVVAEHASYRMSQCFECHQSGMPEMGQ